MDKQQGFSLIEMVIFITVIGILMSGMLVAVNSAQSLAVLPNKAAQATFLANARMEIILLNRAVNGWAAGDPCPTPYTGTGGVAICPWPLSGFAGYTVTSTFTPNTPAVGSTQIDVTVTGNASAKATTVVSNY